MRYEHDELKEAARLVMMNLPDEDRLEIMALFCEGCGCDDPNCQCWNDE